VLGSITKRIDSADVLVFDVSGGNRNVHFELGYAVAKKGAESGRIYIFSDSLPIASDLSALMVAHYKHRSPSLDGKSFELVDARGFRAGLISTLRELAEERLMIGPARQILECEEENTP
jgi:hypothetical protein